MDQPAKQTKEREITYQVGWKKGKINLNEGPAAGSKPLDAREKPVSSKTVSVSGLAPHSEPDKAATWAEALAAILWKEAPSPSLRALVWIFPLVAALIFGMTVWLVSMLSGA